MTELDWAHARRGEEGGENAQVGDDFVPRLRQGYSEVVLAAPNTVGVPLASASDAAAKFAEVEGADLELARNSFQQARTEFITAARQDLGVQN